MFKFRFYLRFFRELYIILVICAVLNMYYLKWGSFGESLNTLVALVLCCITGFYPFIVYCLVQNSALRSKRFKKRFGTLVDQLNVDKYAQKGVLAKF